MAWQTHHGLAHVRRLGQVALGLPMLRCQADVVLADGGARTYLALYRVESQSTVSVSTRRGVFHTLALVESIDIGSLAEVGQPQAMPSALRESPSWRHRCRNGVVIFTIPLPCWRPWFPLPRCAHRPKPGHFGRSLGTPGMSGFVRF